MVHTVEHAVKKQTFEDFCILLYVHIECKILSL